MSSRGRKSAKMAQKAEKSEKEREENVDAKQEEARQKRLNERIASNKAEEEALEALELEYKAEKAVWKDQLAASVPADVHRRQPRDILSLDVGGNRANDIEISTTYTTMRRMPGSRLAALFADGSCFTSDSQDLYFLDRKLEYFLPVLNFLRDERQLFLPADTAPLQRRAVLREFEFWGIPVPHAALLAPAGMSGASLPTDGDAPEEDDDDDDDDDAPAQPKPTAAAAASRGSAAARSSSSSRA